MGAFRAPWIWDGSAVRRQPASDTWIGSQFSLSADGTQTAFVAAGPTEFADVYVGTLAAIGSARRVSDTRAQIASWPAHAREVIRWRSQDGAEIEGVLDQAVEQAKQKAQQPKPDPAQQAAQIEMGKIQAKAQADMQTRQADL